MTRNYLVVYLTENECFPDNDCDSEVAQLWHNAINGETCYIPYLDELDLNTYCHILYELRVDPPLEYDSNYYVYSSFRQVHAERAKIDKSD